MAYHQALYSTFREDQFHAARGEGNPVEMDSEIAGVPNVARASQPDMFSILSWVGEAPRAAPDAAAPSPWPTRIVKKEKVANRWMTESRDQFAWTNKAAPVLVLAGDENDDPQLSPAAAALADSAAASGAPASAPAAASSVKKAMTAEQRQRKRLLRVKRAGMEAAAKTNTSRAMADTAHAEVYCRPAFHNYGRSSTILPGAHTALAEHLVTHNAKPPKDAKWAAPSPTQTSAKDAASYAYASKKKAARKASVPRRNPNSPAAAAELASAELASAPPVPPLWPGDAPRAPAVPPLALQPGPVAAGMPSAREAGPGAALGRAAAWGSPVRLGGNLGQPGHKRAARVPAGPPPGLPPPPHLAPLLGTARGNDPKTYKSLPQEWTCMILPAGTPNPRGVSVSDCLDIFE